MKTTKMNLKNWLTNYLMTEKTPHWLSPRTYVSRKNIWYNANINGKEYSVMDVGCLMKGVPFITFSGWEAIEIVNGKLDVDNIKRADTHQELYKLLTNSSKEE